MSKVNRAAARLVWDRRKKVKNTGDLATIELEILFRGKRKWISTGVRVSAREWDPVRSRVLRRGDMMEINEMLAAWMERCEALFARCAREGEEFSFEMVDRVIGGSKYGSESLGDDTGSEKGGAKDGAASFVDWVQDRISVRKDMRAGTLKNHASFLNMLERYNLERPEMEMRYMYQLTKARVMAWDQWLHARGYKQTTIHGYHKRLKRYIHEAVMMEMLDRSPYELVRIDKGESDGHRYLTRVELERIRELQVDGRIRKARDLFLFQCYTGLAYADMAEFRLEDCEVRDGRYWMRDRRVKSGEVYELLLMRPAVEILERWDGVLPVISNQQYNMVLKVIADMCGIRTRLSSHVGRHTFACLALNEGVKVETLAKMLGHKDIKTTQVYAKVMGKAVETAFLDLEKRL